MIGWPCPFWPMERQYVTVGSPSRARLVASWMENKSE
jgi:hypothetical protein